MGWMFVTLAFVAFAGLSLLSAPKGPLEPGGALPAFDLQGHRGARGLAPENTLPGFEAALAIGVTTLELDLGMTRDGAMVVHHDRRLSPDRTRDAAGAWLELPEGMLPPALIELSAAELAAYDVGRVRPGSKSAERFPSQAGLDGVPIPTLAQVLARAEALSEGSLRYNLETKIAPGDTASADPEAFAAALAALLQETGVAERATVQSFDWRSLQAVQARAPEIATAYLSAERDWLDNIERGKAGTSPWTAGFDIDGFEGSLPAAIKKAGGAIWSPYFRDLREIELREAQRLGLRVLVWTVNDPADMASLIDLGVNGIITDYPDRLRAVMAEKGLSLPPRFPAEGASR